MDKISNYNQIRIVMNVPVRQGEKLWWFASAIRTRNGVPYSETLLDGEFPRPPEGTTPEDFLQALIEALPG